MHTSIKHLLSFFSYDHLPEHLQAVSKPFCDLAHTIAGTGEDNLSKPGDMNLTGPEATVCLRKLLESKDCAVRAAIKPERSA